MQSLNFARKWRCRRLNELKGQDLVVRFLQNSLYRGIYYPVYLFSGMRGTGKTTVARIFSAAMLCKNVSHFQKDTQQPLPCFACDSCNAFYSERHPDIYEIDAASHTGVDTIRSLIDNVYLLPVLSQKKIYIIDEVHMLSKAAFNACLKIMEEPPLHVHFILATTDPHKVLETVRSRSIQLYFNPIAHEEVIDYLAYICSEEKISFEKDALACIARNSQGSMRDALNILERVRLVNDRIDEDAVVACFGVPSARLLISFIDAFIHQDHQGVLQAIVAIQKKTLHPQGLWMLLSARVRECLFEKNKTKQEQKRLLVLLELLYKYESLYMHSASPYGMLELIGHQGFIADLSGDRVKAEIAVDTSSVVKQNQSIVAVKAEEKKIVAVTAESVMSDKKIKSDNDLCYIFMISLAEIDKVLASIMKRASLVFDSVSGKVECTFDKRFLFYRDFINDKKAVWVPLLQRVFGDHATLNIIFQEIAPLEVSPAVKTEENMSNAPVEYSNSSAATLKNTSEKKTYYKDTKTKKNYDGQGSEKSAFGKELAKIFPGVTERI